MKLNQNYDLIKKLEESIKDNLDIVTQISISRGELVIYGPKTSLERMYVILFAHGFIYGWKNKDIPNLRIQNPEVG